MMVVFVTVTNIMSSSCRSAMYRWLMEGTTCDFNALSQVWYVSYVFLATENISYAWEIVAVVARCAIDRLAPGLRGVRMVTAIFC